MIYRDDSRITVTVLFNRSKWADPNRPWSANGYQPGDHLQPVWSFLVPASTLRSLDKMRDACETAFHVLNVDHPNGWADRSMSVGDIVMFGEVAMVCEMVGWGVVSLVDQPT